MARPIALEAITAFRKSGHHVDQDELESDAQLLVVQWARTASSPQALKNLIRKFLKLKLAERSQSSAKRNSRYQDVQTDDDTDWFDTLAVTQPESVEQYLSEFDLSVTERSMLRRMMYKRVDEPDRDRFACDADYERWRRTVRPALRNRITNLLMEDDR